MTSSRRPLATGLLVLSSGGVVSAALFAPEVTDAGFAAVFVAYAAVGWLVTRHQPRNSVGWLLLAFGCLGSTIAWTWGYAALARSVSLPGADFAVWIQSWMWAPVLGIATGPLLVLFPDGHLLSRRWRVVPWLTGIFVVFGVVGNGLYPWPAGEGGPNPYGIEGAEAILSTVTDIAGLALVLSVFGGVAALIVRYRRGDRTQRQQLKWFLAAAVLVPVAIQLGEINNQALQDIVVPIGMSLLAVATGIAILRHGLYDIDRIISRTVGWALVSVVLAAVYLGVVTVLSWATVSLADNSTLAVAASTLVAAAAFRPVRQRVQSSVDRRFYRSRYDAAQTVAAYRARLRDDLDVNSIAGHLQSAVSATLQPRSSVLWLHQPEASS